MPRCRDLAYEAGSKNGTSFMPAAVDPRKQDTYSYESDSVMKSKQVRQTEATNESTWEPQPTLECTGRCVIVTIDTGWIVTPRPICRLRCEVLQRYRIASSSIAHTMNVCLVRTVVSLSLRTSSDAMSITQ